jgi:hypothetical protein
MEKSEFKLKDFFGTITNWSKMVISYSTYESLPRVVIDVNDPEYGSTETAYNISESRAKSLAKAKEKISLQIVRSLEQIRLDNDSTLSELVSSQKNVREKFNEFVLLEQSQIRVKYHQDKVFVESTIYLKGKSGLLNYLSIDYDSEKFPEFADTKVSAEYTGLIIDARHLEINPALFPKVLTEKGLEIYSIHQVSKNFAIDYGLVSYQTDPEIAMKDLRVGKKPYYLVALNSIGKNKTDISITTKDAKVLLSSKANLAMLRKCAVIILVDQPKTQN